jgi:hypothetical protein
MSKFMKKFDINKNITVKFTDNDMMATCCQDSEDMDPQIRECDEYKALIAYFRNAEFSIKNGDKRKKLIIKHPNYPTLKISEDHEKYNFDKTSVINRYDSLVAKISMDIDIPDIQLLNQEFKITATRKKNCDKYGCALISHNNTEVYNRNKKRA